VCCLLDEVSCDDEDVAGQDASPHVGGEGLGAAPVAAVEAEGSLEKGDPSLDTGSEVPELAEDPLGLCHVDDLEANVLAEHDISAS
jgi:hypothetical protein